MSATGDPPASDDPSTPADLAFVGGAVHTVEPSRPWAEAVAVRAGRIVAVGTDDEVRAHVAPSTEVVELGGRMVLPGFQDSHIHASTAGLDRLRVDLSEGHSLDDYDARISAYVRANPDVEWIVGGGWSMDLFPGGTPTAEQLDRVAAGRPAFLANRDLHGVWVSSRALEIAGITRDTPDPPDGRIERSADGNPTGTLHEGAVSLVRRFVPRPTVDEQVRGILVAQEHLHSLGITGWQEAIVGEYMTMVDPYEAYLALAADGRLTARVVGALWFERDRAEDQIEGFVARRARASQGRFRATSVKIMQDGVCENFTAAMLQPYQGRPGTGISFVDPEVLQKCVPMLDAEGFQLHIHAIGDRGHREALDALEAAVRSNGPNDNRHHIAHLHVIHPDDVPRFGRLGVTANAQPLWAAYEPQMIDLTLPFLGPERSAWQYPYASLVANGARLAFGSDWPVSSANPFEEMHVAVNRTSPPAYPYGGGEEYEPFYPDERLDLKTAIAAFTMGSAFVAHNDFEVGSIRVGKLADLIVVDRNLFEHQPDGFSDAKVLLTLVEGAKVFEAAGL